MAFKRPANRIYSEEQIRFILTSNQSPSQLAKILPGSRQLIKQVQIGAFYADVLPELPRRELRKRKTCQDCSLFRSGWKPGENPCSLLIPEAGEQGVYYATDCAIIDETM